MCIGSIVRKKHLQSVSYRFCLERKLFKHTRYAAILSKRIFDFIFRAISSCTLYLFQTLA
jgi:hypothetical protein